jgi:hypothetical protein
MFGNPKWFKRRKFGGWGITPCTMQGWLYILSQVVLLFSTIFAMNYANVSSKNIIMTAISLIALIVIDQLHIMLNIDKDERETLHEAISERNVTWAIISVLVVGFIYQALVSISLNVVVVDPFIVIALIFGVLTKGATNWYLRDK